MKLAILLFILWFIFILYKIIFPLCKTTNFLKTIFSSCAITILTLFLYFLPLIGIKIFATLGNNNTNIGIYALVFWLGIIIIVISISRFIFSLLIAFKLSKFFTNKIANSVLFFIAVLTDVFLYKIMGQGSIIYYILVYSITFVYLPFFMIFAIKLVSDSVKNYLKK